MRDAVQEYGCRGQQVQLPPRQLRVVEAGHFGCAARCKNKAMLGELMQKLRARVGSISHSTVNNDMLKELQKLEEDLHRTYELIKQNDSR